MRNRVIKILKICVKIYDMEIISLGKIIKYIDVNDDICEIKIISDDLLELDGSVMFIEGFIDYISGGNVYDLIGV